MPKRVKRKKIIHFSKKLIKGNTTLYILLVVLVLGSAIFTGLFSTIKPRPGENNNPVNIACCDTGDGPDCKPQTGPEKEITFNNQKYGLLRTKVQFIEGNLHMEDSGDKFNNDPIIVNTGERSPIPTGFNQPPDCKNGEDKYFRKYAPPEDLTTNERLIPYCISIPDDQIVFVCKKNCFPSICPSGYTSGVKCYGDRESVFDVYFRLSDEQTPGVPNFIKNCDKTGLGTQPLPSGVAKQKIIIKDQTSPKKNLQLKTFTVEQELNLNPWLSPFCKPAIYLYPKEKTKVNVKINPKGKITLTIPNYPENGWKVTAYPDGKIESDNVSYDYLYYEAKIPNELIENKTKQGYVVSYNELNLTLKTLLPKLGLNNKEQNEFLDYWLKVLPKSPLYFVGVVPQDLLNEVSPLDLNPKPDTLIRVTLYFKPLNTKIEVEAPLIPKIERKGFTVVEWGGLFKTDDKHPFTCLM